MAKVSLRIYNREIESLIDQNHLDEAIAHCHHILQTFPKHLETYRLLGKAYLEAKQYTEAVDIFNRVLIAVPDDFVSHVGMSIIRDDEGKLDDAIWHMERAFESQPSNAAIQSEMQRLYGRRDGVEPPKIRMTRGALAHMYFQGELYPQAISEIRAVLGQDPQRADMQVLLARAYFQGGQKVDASDLCSQLLKRYPYCFDANRIMVELLPATDRAENTQVYRHRVNELDPYALFAKESIFRSNEVPDASVNLERLEYTGQSVEVAPDWGTSLGIGLTSGSSISSEQPDWLKAGLSESQPDTSLDVGPTSISSSEAVPASSNESDIPDFLRQAGWSESMGRAEEPSPLDSSPAGNLTPAIIPDWLKNQMPPEAEQPPKQAVSSGDMPDWLGGLGSSESTEAVPGDIPDWLQDLGKEQPEQQAVQPEPAPKNEASVSADLTPDWLSSFSETEPEQPEPASDAEPPKAAPRAVSIETLGTTEKEQDDAVAWLEMLAAKHGAKPEELVTDPNARKETPPEWVEQARSIAESKSEEQPVTPEFGKDETGMWLRDLSEKEPPSLVGEEAKSSVSDQELPDWLRGLESPSSEAQPASERVAEEPQPASDVPDWLSEIQSKSDVQPVMETPAEQKSDLPDWLSGIQDESISKQDLTATGAPEKQDVADWLSGLDQEPPAEKAVSEPKTEPIPQPRADIPEWLRGLESSSVTGIEEQAEKPLEEPAVSPLSETEEPTPVPPTAAELPEWLRGIDETQQAEELPEPLPQTEEPAPVAPAAAELPEWLRGVDETQPEEELPEEPAVSSIAKTEEPTPVAPTAVELPEWLRGVDETQPEEELPEEPAVVSPLSETEEPTPISPAAAEMTEWSRRVDETQPEEERLEEPTASALPQAEELTPSAAAEIPEWLRGVDAGQPEEERPEQPSTSISPLPVAEEAEETAPVPSVATELPEWLRGIEETKAEEGSEEARENLPAWLQSEFEEEEPRPAPITATDWHPAEPQPESPAQEPEPEFDASQPPMPSTMQPAIDMGQPEPPSPNVYEPTPGPTPIQKPSRPTRVRQVETSQASVEMANQAKEELIRGDIPTAVNHYTKLIKKGKHLDEAIRDLRESLYRYPVEVSIWQTLGDAYMRANRLQDALDAYNKAEELLR